VVRSEDVVVVGQETVDGEAEEPDPDMKKSNRRCAGSRLEFGRLPDWICSEDNLTFHCLVSLFPLIDSGNVPFSHPIVDIPCVTITCRTSLCVTHCCKVGRCARAPPAFLISKSLLAPWTEKQCQFHKYPKICDFCICC